MKFIPNLLTLLNLFCGFIAIVHVFAGQTDTAVMFMGFSLLFDFLDGFAARALGVVSKVGIELDSLADVVSFGFLPATFVYTGLFLAAPESGAGDPFWMAMPAAILVCSAAYRLAKFNVDDTGDDCFRGLPTPAAAIFIISMYYFTAEIKLSNYWIWLAALLLISFLMVSRMPLLSFKRLFKSKAGIIFSAVSMLILVILLFVFGLWTSFVFVPAYLFSSFIYFFVLKKNQYAH